MNPSVIDGFIRHRSPILQGRSNAQRLLRRQVGEGLELQSRQVIRGQAAWRGCLFSLFRFFGFFRLFRRTADHEEEEEGTRPDTLRRKNREGFMVTSPPDLKGYVEIL